VVYCNTLFGCNLSPAIKTLSLIILLPLGWSGSKENRIPETYINVKHKYDGTLSLAVTYLLYVLYFLLYIIWKFHQWTCDFSFGMVGNEIWTLITKKWVTVSFPWKMTMKKGMNKSSMPLVCSVKCEHNYEGDMSSWPPVEYERVAWPGIYIFEQLPLWKQLDKLRYTSQT